MNMEIFVLFITVLFIIFLVFLAYVIFTKPERKKITLSNPNFSLDVEIANSMPIRLKGLMGRKSLGENEGMLFVFNRSDRYGFWMFNTTIPLEAIHINENFTVVDIVDMKPCGLNLIKCKTYTPKEPSMYVLEVNSGFSKRHGVQINKTKLELK